MALKSARSVRVVLVIKEARGDVGNERGRVLLKDVEHVASMFCNFGDMASIGLIVTSEPRGLQVPGVAQELAHSMKGLFAGLLETALAEDEYVDVGHSVGMARHICRWAHYVFYVVEGDVIVV